MDSIKKVIKIGNSNGVVIPSKVLKELNLSEGDRVSISKNKDGIQIKPTQQLPENFEAMLAESMNKYKDALNALKEGDQNGVPH
ncbi:AbrB/MazE/SpoVT family DNA-binding domain-containing protein [Lentilactobacillus sp. Marseille-Q4993]|uniref:AbrB/MazE/SpoVT family DNA-binding domain-containing protein n=1 Tax=Lentilactobacillus sp. Marseille-Q4993 TaxID=3039492 RepID=UPI0024BCD903|nr:AbrB/MazE/SpoVT family DNA-binding domain-containing protein [Lentilactobacillus sp. Marseille-Q4993]